MDERIINIELVQKIQGEKLDKVIILNNLKTK
jgi:hypothetical protein